MLSSCLYHTRACIWRRQFSISPSYLMTVVLQLEPSGKVIHATLVLHAGYKRARIFATFRSYLVFSKPPDTLLSGAPGDRIELRFVITP